MKIVKVNNTLYFIRHWLRWYYIAIPFTKIELLTFPSGQEDEQR